MNADRLEALLWKRVDGVLGDDEAAELEAFLKQHPESAELEDDIAALALRLNQVENVQPPAALRQLIDHSLARANPPGHRTATAGGSIQRTHQGRWRRQLLPLAAGLVLGAAITSLMLPGAWRGVHGSNATGTMAIPTADGDLETVEIDLGQTVGRLSATGSRSRLVLDLELSVTNNVEIRLEASPDPLRLLGAEQIGSPASRLVAMDTSVVLETTGPSRHQLIVALTESTGAMRVVVNVDGEVLAERSMRIEVSGGGE